MDCVQVPEGNVEFVLIEYTEWMDNRKERNDTKKKPHL